MYGNIYRPRWSCQLSNQKYITPSSLSYDAPPNDIPYRSDNNRSYSYTKPNPAKPAQAAPAEKAPATKESYAADTGMCGIDSEGTSVCGSGRLLPVMDPRFNLREAAKNMILLEDHLFHEGKRCRDCILKHCLTIEAFLEEAVTLDKTAAYKTEIKTSLAEWQKIYKVIAEKIRNNELTDDDCCAIAQQIRSIRKPLCQKFATFMAS